MSGSGRIPTQCDGLFEIPETRRDLKPRSPESGFWDSGRSDRAGWVSRGSGAMAKSRIPAGIPESGVPGFRRPGVGRNIHILEGLFGAPEARNLGRGSPDSRDSWSQVSLGLASDFAGVLAGFETGIYQYVSNPGSQKYRDSGVFLGAGNPGFSDPGWSKPGFPAKVVSKPQTRN